MLETSSVSVLLQDFYSLHEGNVITFDRCLDSNQSKKITWDETYLK